MKNIINKSKIWVLVIPAFMLLFSCSEKLDLKPYQSIDASRALTSPENIKAALIGAYLQARSASLFGSQFNEFSELYAATTDMNFIGTYVQPREFLRKQASVTNSYVENTWVEAYELINICNTLLDGETLDIIDAGPDRDRIEGAAKFLRGW
ncbi:MAG TPA: RagB/SusD family nutrient uptake outer membrane protein, partial [Bacteroidales bacterium]|nr:RagB/SusD family nutrient uptake outer membrane protein [Bacteroidales bacterium]